MISKPETNLHPNRPHEKDLNLVDSVSRGSVKSWHDFLRLYSGLIYSVTKRHFPFESEDDVRTIYVDILKSLYDSDLAKYGGQVSLATWLILVVRRKALDHIRSLYGRYREPAGFKNLNDFDKKIFKLYYLEKLNIDVVIHTLNWNGLSADIDRVLESIERIESELDRRFLDRLDKDHLPGKKRNGSAALVEYLNELKLEYERHADSSSPYNMLADREKQRVEERLRSEIAKLPPEDQKVINLRFKRGLPAKQISRKLNLGGQRKVYTIINRVIRNLRSSLQYDETGKPGNGGSP